MNIPLEDKMVEGFLPTYPPEVHESVRWLLGYLRDNCNREVDLLETQVKKLGYGMTRSTFSKILRGKYFQVRNGRMEGSPDNFVEVVDALRRAARIASTAGRITFVETETWKQIQQFIDLKRAPNRVNKFGVIVGPTGMQKTACLLQYQSLNNHGMTTYIEAPHTASMGAFLSRLGKAFGISDRFNTNRIGSRIYENVNEHKVVIVDNVQRLYKPSAAGDQPIFSFLQALQDETGCTVILSFTPAFMDTFTTGVDRGYFEQFEGRAGGRRGFLVLPNFPPRADVLAIAEAFGLQDARQHVRLLEKLGRERGRIRILFEVLQSAKVLADAQGSPFTVQHLQEVIGEEAA